MALTKVTSGLISADASSVDLNIDAGTLYIDATNNNVGISTTSPTDYYSDRLVVTAGNEDGITIAASATTNANYLMFADGTTGNEAYRGFISYDHNSDSFNIASHGFLRIYSGSSIAERMRIDSSGNVGIGTNSPQYKLSLNDASTSAYPLVLENGNIGTAGVHTGIRFGYSGNSYQKGAIIFEGQDSAARGKMYFAMEGTADSSNADETDAKMTIDYSGNVGIGTSSPEQILHLAEASAGGIGPQLVLDNNTSSNLNNACEISFLTDGGASSTGTRNARITAINTNAGSGAAALTFYTWSGSSDAERMRITSSGELMLNTTSNPNPVNGSGQLNMVCSTGDGVNIKHTNNGFNSLNIWQTGTSTFNAIGFYKGNSQTVVGLITCTTSATSYNTSSDYRLKENIQPLANGLERLQQLNPVQFDWKESGETSEGFIAHEVQEIFSDAVSGEKDGEDMQGMDYGRITPLLVKAIQEQQVLIEQLQAEVALLKGE